MGTTASFVCPSPVAPFSPWPHVKSRPSIVSATMCALPQATATIARPSKCRLSTLVGVVTLLVCPQPSWPLLLRPVGGIERVEYGRRQEYGFEKTVLKYVGNESDFPLMVSRKEQCTHDAASGWQLSESSRAILDGLADAKQTCFRNGRQLSEAIISFNSF